MLRRNVSRNAALCAWPQLWRLANVSADGTAPHGTCPAGAGAVQSSGLPGAAFAPAIDDGGLQGTLQVCCVRCRGGTFGVFNSHAGCPLQHWWLSTAYEHLRAE